MEPPLAEDDGPPGAHGQQRSDQRDHTTKHPRKPRRRTGRRQYLIGDVAALTGLTPHALRAWEKVGLLVPRRSPAGVRQFSEDDLARVRLIVRTLRTRRLSRRAVAALLDAGELRPDPSDYTLGHRIADEDTSDARAAAVDDGQTQQSRESQQTHLAELKRLHAVVAGERARWQTAMDEVSALVLACDTSFNVTYVNRAFEQVLGVAVPNAAATPEDWVAHYNFQQPDGSGPFAPAAFPVVRAIREKRPIRDVLLLRYVRDGMALLTSWDASPVMGADGSVIGCVAIGRDVTAERRRSQREACLMAVARAAAGAPDPARMAGRVAHVLDALAAYGGVPVVSAALHLLDEPAGVLRRTNVFGSNPASRSIIALDEVRQHAPLSEPHYSADDARPPLWYDAEQHARWPAAGIRSWATLPLRGRGGPLGTLAIGLGAQHVWDAAERAWIEACADAVALAYENDRLLAAERRHTSELEAVVTGVNIGILLVAPDGRVLVRNPAAAKIEGAPRERKDIQRLPSMYTIRDITTGELIAPNDTALARALRGETVRDQSRLIRDGNGRERVVRVSGAPVRDENGAIMAAIITLEDVTKSTRQRNVSEQLFARLGAALEPAEEMSELVGTIVDTGDMAAAAVYTTTPDGQALELLVARNYPPEVAKAVAHLPIDAPSIASLALRTRQPHFIQNWNEANHPELMLTRQMAEQLGAQSGVAVPLLARGAVVGVLTVTSAREGAFSSDEVSLLLGLAGRAGLALANARLYQTARTTAAQLDAIIKSMANGVWVCDAQGNITLMNAVAAEIASVPDSQLPSTLAELDSIQRPCWPDGQPMALEDAPLSRALRDEVSTDFEVILHQARSDKPLTLRVSYAPIRDDKAGNIVGAVMVGRDITQIRDLERARAEFLALVSHELKTPLTSLLGFVQLLRRRRNQPPEMAPEDVASAGEARTRESDWIERIEYQAHRLERLVNDLLDVVRYNRGQIEYRWTVGDVAGAIAEAVDEQRVAQPDRLIRLTAPTEMLLARIDADRIAQLMTNLLTNALKYSRAEQPVDVVLEEGTGDSSQGGHVVVVRVRDYGPGIPVEHRDHVFERFYRVPGIEVQSGSGIGLGAGLYVAREIVERHGGSIKVADQQGPGACFAFTLPLVESATP